MLRDAFRSIHNAISDVSSVRDRAHRSAVGSMYRRWCAAHPCPVYPTRFDLYESVLDSEHLGSPIDYLEFGVWQGETIRWWSENNLDPTSAFHGFDSFEGLPGQWEGVPEGAFSTGGAIPDTSDPRCHFVKGYFHQTVPGWLAGRALSRRLVVNLDADLYGSTLLVLIQLMPLLKPGDILFFDEFHSYMHEFRALQDALTAHPMAFRSLGRACGWSQLALAVA
jgi:O-methyltransferase